MNIEFENILDADEELIEQIRKWRNSKQVSQYMYTDHHISKDEHNKWIQNLKTKNTARAWVIKSANKPIGLASLSDIDYSKKITDWGFYIADKKMRGKGIGTLVLHKLMNIVFDDMKFDEMKTMVLNNNTVAIRLYEKMGFTKTSVLDEKQVRDEKAVEIIVMNIDKEKWRKIEI